MIGNDVVDLEASGRESNWQRKGWMEKLFTRAEQMVIHHASAPETMVWLLWSMKEAAYKLHYRDTGISFFAPADFSGTLTSLTEGTASGLVRFGHCCYYTRSLLTSGFIHTSAALQNNLQEATVYVCETAMSRTYPGNHIFFKDNKGIPYLVDCLSGKVRDVSYSHHGRWEALVFFQ